MMTQLQKIVAKAKSLKKSYPNTKWTDLIKKASKLVTPAKKSVSGINRKVVAKKSAPVKPLIKKRIESKSDFAMAGVKKKKATKKSVGYKDDRIEQLRKATPYIRKYTEKGFDRKEAIKNAMLDAGYLRGINIDTDAMINRYKNVLKEIEKYQETKRKIKIAYSVGTKSEKARAKLMIKKIDGIIRELKVHSRQIKSYI